MGHKAAEELVSSKHIQLRNSGGWEDQAVLQSEWEPLSSGASVPPVRAMVKSPPFTDTGDIAKELRGDPLKQTEKIQ